MKPFAYSCFCHIKKYISLCLMVVSWCFPYCATTITSTTATLTTTHTTITSTTPPLILLLLLLLPLMLLKFCLSHCLYFWINILYMLWINRTYRLWPIYLHHVDNGLSSVHDKMPYTMTDRAPINTHQCHIFKTIIDLNHVVPCTIRQDVYDKSHPTIFAIYQTNVPFAT